ncbi:MAG TPA: type 1 glutamine amidotransferase [Mycobacteriales bacterium]|nr:type 1 glutamine amidotransferase [Mycobacteriales bacterium]
MPTALVIQHAAVEGPGRFAEWLPSHGLELDVVHAYAGYPVPDVMEHDALIVMGGPMGAYDDVDVPWLAATKKLLADAVEAELPTLGICLGAQLLAVATGGKVERGAAGPELGLGEVTGDGSDRVLLSGPYVVVQWHYDTVTELPPDATLLASSALYPVQAFRVGEAAWGLQFHVEATPELVGKWARAEGREVEGIVEPIRHAEKSLALIGEAIARRFAYVVSR